MKKNKILLSVLGVVVVIALAIVAVIVFVPGGKDLVKPSGDSTSPKPIPTSTPTESPLVNTKQFKDVSAKYSQFLTNGDLGPTPAPIMVLGVASATSYVDKAINNPYFVSGYWGAKDNYMPDSISKYLSPLLSKKLNSQFLDAAKDSSKPEFKQFFENKVYFPDASLQISPQCFDTWKTDYCFAKPPTVESLSYKGISPTSVQIQLTTVVDVLYQKPDAFQGNLISQTRAYTFSFVLDETNAPKSKDTDLPIMTISSMDASLEIRGQADYLINEG